MCFASSVEPTARAGSLAPHWDDDHACSLVSQAQLHGSLGHPPSLWSALAPTSLFH